MKYAAIDAIESLKVYFHLQQLPDLTARANHADAVVGAVFDLVPKRGSVAEMASRVGVATVVATTGSWINPIDGCKPCKLNITTNRRLVEVTKVIAPNFALPRDFMKRPDGSGVCLADFGPVPFRVPVSLTMLAPQVLVAAPNNAQAPNAAAVSNGVAAPNGVAGAPTGAPNAAAAQIAPTSLNNAADPNDAAAPIAAVAPDIAADGEDDEAGDDLDFEDLSYEDVQLIEAARELGDAAPCNLSHKYLDPPPDTIIDRYSSVCGDTFHYEDRPRVPVRHEYKKAYFVAQRDAWLEFDQGKLRDVKHGLETMDNMSGKEIRSMLYYKFSWFRERVPRHVAKPSLLYWRVRRVYEMFGSRIDSASGQIIVQFEIWQSSIDLYQLIVEQNHDVIPHPDWSNATDFVPTDESFGTVPLHSEELGKAISKISIDFVKIKLTQDQKYMCKAMGVKLPLLPVDGHAECQLFDKMALEQS